MKKSFKESYFIKDSAEGAKVKYGPDFHNAYLKRGPQDDDRYFTKDDVYKNINLLTAGDFGEVSESTKEKCLKRLNNANGNLVGVYEDDDMILYYDHKAETIFVLSPDDFKKYPMHWEENYRQKDLPFSYTKPGRQRYSVQEEWARDRLESNELKQLGIHGTGNTSGILSKLSEQQINSIQKAADETHRTFEQLTGAMIKSCGRGNGIKIAYEQVMTNLDKEYLIVDSKKAKVKDKKESKTLIALKKYLKDNELEVNASKIVDRAKNGTLHKYLDNAGANAHTNCIKKIFKDTLNYFYDADESVSNCDECGKLIEGEYYYSQDDVFCDECGSVLLSPLEGMDGVYTYEGEGPDGMYSKDDLEDLDIFEKRTK